MPSGYLGVDIFFCISGFVITSSLNQFSNKNIKDFITKFYVRRIKRLLPALSVFVVISSIAICLFNPEPSRTLVTGLTSLFGFSNLYLLKLSTNYFAQSTQLNLFTHTWSLGVEQQFYILFPFLVWFTGFGRYTKNGSRNLFLVIGVLTIGSLISFVTLYSNNQEAAYFLMPTRFWEMGAGSLLFIGLQKKGAIKKLFEKAPPIIILMLIIVVMCLPISWAVVSTILVVIFTSFLIGSLRNSSLLFKVFTHPKIIYIGLISYSLYLWHWSVLSISRWTFGIYWWSIPLQLALIIGLAIASYEWIETPLRDGSWVKKKLHTLSVGLGILITISLNFGVAPQNNFGILTNLLRGKGIFGNQLITKVSFLMHKFQKKLYTGNQYNKWKMKQFGEKIIINNPKISTIYLIGDSHSAHYGAAFTHLVAEKKHNLIMHPRGEGLRLTKEVAGQEDYILAPLRRYKNNTPKNK